jgi:hypothetical protein
LLAEGGCTGSYTFLLKDQILHFLNNFLAIDKFWLHSNQVVPVGKVELRCEFEPPGIPDVAQGKGVPAYGQLYINRKLVTSIGMPHSIQALYRTEGLTAATTVVTVWHQMTKVMLSHLLAPSNVSRWIYPMS